MLGPVHSPSWSRQARRCWRGAAAGAAAGLEGGRGEKMASRLGHLGLLGRLLVEGKLVRGRLAGSRLGSGGSRRQLGSQGPVVGELVVGVAARALVLLGSCQGPQAAVSSQVELAGQGGGLQELSVEKCLVYFSLAFHVADLHLL